MAILYAPPAAHGHFYYDAAQLAAFVLYVGLLLAHGHRRGYPWRQWLPLVAAATLALMLGCQLVFLPLGQWLPWLRGDAAVVHALAEGPRSVVGGAVASLLAVLTLKRILGFRGWAVLDAFAGPLCWALVAQCVGCVLAGCCWGEVNTTGLLSFSYAPGTLPYLAQQAQGLLPVGAAQSLPVVPTQLYQLLLCAGVGLVVHAARHRAWPGGSRYLLAMGLLCLGRFALEGWRDPAGEPLLGAPVVLGGIALAGIRWLLLAEAAVLLGHWGWLVRRPLSLARPVVAAGGHPALVGLGLLAATGWLAPSLLSPPEILTLQGLLLAMLVAESQHLLAGLGHRTPRLAGLPLSVLLGGALLLSVAQAPAPERTPPADRTPPDNALIFSTGYLSNSHDALEDIRETNAGCSGSQPLAMQQRVRAGGLEVAAERNDPASDYTSTWGGGVWAGQQRIDLQPLPYSGSYFITQQDTTLRKALVDFHVYREIHRGSGWTAFGVRAGLHAGSLGYFSYFDGGNARGTTWLMPELMLRLGNPRVVYGQADFCYGAENTLGACTSRLALGSGLGQLRGSQVLAGYAHSAHSPTQNMAFVSANLRLPGGTGLSALSLEPYFATDFDRHQSFSLKVNYRLGR